MIFVDSSFWIATRLTSDRHHAVAVELLSAHGRGKLGTSSHVVGETLTFLNRRAGHRSAMHFLGSVVRSPRLEVVFVSEELEREALEWLERHDERPYSFVDATSFALMRSLGITRALAFDGDFGAAGFEELRPQHGGRCDAPNARVAARQATDTIHRALQDGIERDALRRLAEWDLGGMTLDDLDRLRGRLPRDE